MQLQLYLEQEGFRSGGSDRATLTRTYHILHTPPVKDDPYPARCFSHRLAASVEGVQQRCGRHPRRYTLPHDPYAVLCFGHTALRTVQSLDGYGAYLL